MTRALSGKCSCARGLRRIRNQGQGVQHAAYRDSAEQILNVRHTLHHESPLIAHTSIKTINSQPKKNRSAPLPDSEQLYFHLDISYSVITKSRPSGLLRLGARHEHFFHRTSNSAADDSSHAKANHCKPCPTYLHCFRVKLLG